MHSQTLLVSVVRSDTGAVEQLSTRFLACTYDVDCFSGLVMDTVTVSRYIYSRATAWHRTIALSAKIWTARASLRSEHCLRTLSQAARACSSVAINKQLILFCQLSVHIEERSPSCHGTALYAVHAHTAAGRPCAMDSSASS